MTDFGRKAGLGDMLKSVYDPNADGVIAVAQTEADMKKSVYDTDDDGKVDALDEHAGSHEDAGSDEIEVTGLVGATPLAMLADATPGRVFRASALLIKNGTSAATLKCTLVNLFNGDVISETDNIAKDATTGNFNLSADGSILTILATGLSGNVLHALGFLGLNASATTILLTITASANNIRTVHMAINTEAYLDLTTLVDTGNVYSYITYITDA